MAVYDGISISERLQSLINDFTNNLVDLPVERRDRIERDLQKIRSEVNGLLQTESQPDVPVKKKTGLFFDHLRDAALILEGIRDKAGNIQDWYFQEANNAALQTLGLQRAELIGKTGSELFGAELVRWVSLHLSAVFEKGEPSQHGESYRGRHFLITMFRIDKNTAGIITVDITERKRVEDELHIANAALSTSEVKYRELAESITDPFTAYDSNLRLVYRNQASKNATQIPDEQVLGRPFSELYPNLVGGEIHQAYLRTLETHQPQHHLSEWVRPSDGQKFYYDLSLYPNNDGLVAYSKDITRRVRAEQELRENTEALRRYADALRESEERERSRANELETLMDAVPSLIWISRDSACKEMFGNRQGYEFLGLGPGSNISKTAPKAALEDQQYRYVKDGKLIPPTELPMQVAAATGKPAQDYMFDLLFDDGTIYNLMGNVNPLFDRDGKPSGAVGAFTDITGLLRLEAEKGEAKAQIEVQRRLMEYREQERQGIARDLHDGPIQTLAGTAFNLQFIKEAYQDPTLRVELEQVTFNVKSAVRELREIVNDLRPPSLIRFGLAKTVQIHADDILERHPEIKIELSLAEDNNRLSEQACLTLFRIYQEGLNNAVRHSGASVVSVVYRIEEDVFILELRDNGRGFRVTQDLSDVTSEGHFGLAGMKERAETIGAEFHVTSELGKGTSIFVKGPLIGKNLK